MPRTPVIPWAATAVAVVILLASGCIRTPRLDSHWPAASIHVDGADTDWSDRRYVLETLNVTVAVANDSNYLYLCVVTSDHSVQMQVVRRGIELWIDPRGYPPFELDSPVGLGLRLPVPDRPMGGMSNPRGDFGGGGGGGFGGAGGRRMGGGRGAGMSGMSMETLEQWIEVELREP